MGEYTGFKEIAWNDDLAGYVFADPCKNVFECLTNEYLMLRSDDGDPPMILRCDGETMSIVQHRTIKSSYIGEIKPRNEHQKMAIDMLYNPTSKIKVICGPYGSGKDYLMCGAAMELLEKEKFDHIVYVRNNIEVEHSNPIGFLPGGANDKLLPFAMPLADHLGGVDGLNHVISQGELEIVHFGFIRGRDFRNSIVLCSEAENMTTAHIKLLIGRIGEGSELWINGDTRQSDAAVFRKDNGLDRMIDRLKGNPLFGYVRLMKTERSETAALSDLLD